MKDERTRDSMHMTPFNASDMLTAETVICPVRYHAQICPDRNAVVSVRQSLTYAELDTRIDRAARRLRKLSQETSPCIGIYRSDPLDTVVWLFAVLRLGGSAVFPGDRQPVGVMESIRAQAPFSCLITPEKNIKIDVPVTPSRLEPGDTDENDGVGADAFTSADSAPGTGGEYDSSGWTLSLPATWLYTSGSSGLPRLAVHSVRNHLLNAISANQRTPVGANSRWLLSLPLFHVGGIGILFRVFIAGAATVIPETAQPIDDSIFSLRPSHMSLVATQLRRLLTACPMSPETLESVLIGGGPIESSLLRSAVRGGYPVRTTYGMTEFSSQVATSEVHREEKQEFLAGRPLDGTQVEIGQNGEILVRTPSLFLGYASNGRIESPVTTDGWFGTGDIGTLVGSELSILGRKDEMFVSGGENIYPDEIERELNACAEVEMSIVVPVPDEEFGFRPAAVIRWADAKPREESVFRQLEKRLPKFKVPDVLIEWPDEMVEQGMKVSRSAVKKLVLKAWAKPR